MKYLVPTTQIFSTSEIELHYKRPQFTTMQGIYSAVDAEMLLKSYIKQELLDLKEHFWVVLLTQANRVISICEVASGTTLGVQTNPKYIFQLALLTNASAIIVAHNHPSGNLNFSERDINETKKLKRLAKTLDLTLLDHLIITSESFTSMKQEDLL